MTAPVERRCSRLHRDRSDASLGRLAGARRSTSRSRRAAPAAAREGDADLRGLPAGASTPGSTCRPASRSACRRTCPRRCSSSSGAPRSAASSAMRCTQLKYGGERRLADPLGARDRAALGARRGRWRPPRARAGPPRPRAPARLRPGRAARPRPRRPRLGLPVRRRPRAAAGDASPSSTSTASDRAANVAGAFAAAIARPRSRPSRGRWVVLVDDVVTTGATPVGLRGGAPRRRRDRRLGGHRRPRALTGRDRRRSARRLGTGARPTGLYSTPPDDSDRREVTRADDRQGQERRGPGPRPRLRRAQARPPRAAARRPHRRHRRALERAPSQRGGRPHRRGHAGHRRPDAAQPCRRAPATRRPSTTVVDKVERQAVDHKEKPRVRAAADRGEAHPAVDRRRDAGAGAASRGSSRPSASPSSRCSRRTRSPRWRSSATRSSSSSTPRTSGSRSSTRATTATTG